MLSVLKKTHAFATATVLCAAVGVAAPQAVASETPNTADITHLAIASSADKETQDAAAANPRKVQVMATLCGAGYELQKVTQLPDSRRFGTLFVYTKFDSPISSCALFDNNTTSAKYMKLKLCSNQVNGKCVTDEGTYTQYAGPIRLTAGLCSEVTAIMKTSKTAAAALIDRVSTVPPCN